MGAAALHTPLPITTTSAASSLRPAAAAVAATPRRLDGLPRRLPAGGELAGDNSGLSGAAPRRPRQQRAGNGAEARSSQRCRQNGMIRAATARALGGRIAAERRATDAAAGRARGARGARKQPSRSRPKPRTAAAENVQCKGFEVEAVGPALPRCRSAGRTAEAAGGHVAPRCSRRCAGPTRPVSAGCPRAFPPPSYVASSGACDR